MKQTHSIQQKTLQLFAILLPILITQLTIFLMGFFDTVMSGNYRSDDLAGVAIGSSLWIPLSTGLNGILLAITPIVAQLIGGNKREKIAYYLVQGIYLAIFISLIIIGIGFLCVSPILHIMELESTVHTVAKGYLLAIAFGVIPYFMYTALRAFIDAHGHTRITMVISLLALPINVVLNYILIYGKLGFPQLGGIGAGVATSITYWIIIGITLFFIAKFEPFRSYGIFRSIERISLSAWKEFIKLGLPIGFSIFFETGIFSLVTLLMSPFGKAMVAAHTSALNFASFIYNIPLSFSMALTILIGFEVGARRYRDAKHYSYLGIGISVLIAVFTAIFLAFNRQWIAGIYTNELDVMLIAQQFLVYAIFFQFSDAIATPIQGILRGYKDVNAPFILSFIAFWVIGLPLGYILANYTPLGAFGYWVGLISGLAFGAISLSIRLLLIQKRFQSQS